jgi:hypothetical protein
MLRCITMFKLKDIAGGKSKIENGNEIKQFVDSFKDNIAEIRSFEVGVSSYQLPNQYDLVFIQEFDSLEGMNKFRAHPDHIKLAELLSNVVADSEDLPFVCYDYEDQ